MELVIGATYDVEINDCCVRGEFVSKLIKAQNYDEKDELHDTEKLEYGTELTFENGVSLTAWNGVALKQVE